MPPWRRRQEPGRVPNPDGSGLSLPFNFLVYGGAALLMGVCWRANTTVPNCDDAELSHDHAACLLLAIYLARIATYRRWRLVRLFFGAAFYQRVLLNVISKTQQTDRIL